MRDLMLRVDPAADGWWIECDLPLQPTFFQSGARAEAAARDLALRWSDAGYEVQLVIRDRLQQTVASYRYPAA